MDDPPTLCRPATDLQVGADDGLSLGELKVFPHEEVEQRRRLRLGGAGAVVAALEDLVAQAAAQVRLALEERAGELQTGGAAVRRTSRDVIRDCAFAFVPSDLLHKEPERCKDVPQGGGGLVDLKEQQVGVQHLLHQCVLSVVHHQLLLHGQEEEEEKKNR